MKQFGCKGSTTNEKLKHDVDTKKNYCMQAMSAEYMK